MLLKRNLAHWGPEETKWFADRLVWLDEAGNSPGERVFYDPDTGEIRRNLIPNAVLEKDEPPKHFRFLVALILLLIVACNAPITQPGWREGKDAGQEIPIVIIPNQDAHQQDTLTLNWEIPGYKRKFGSQDVAGIYHPEPIKPQKPQPEAYTPEGPIWNSKIPIRTPRDLDNKVSSDTGIQAKITIFPSGEVQGVHGHVVAVQTQEGVALYRDLSPTPLRLPGKYLGRYSKYLVSTLAVASLEDPQEIWLMPQRTLPIGLKSGWLTCAPEGLVFVPYVKGNRRILYQTRHCDTPAYDRGWVFVKTQAHLVILDADAEMEATVSLPPNTPIGPVVFDHHKIEIPTNQGLFELEPKLMRWNLALKFDPEPEQAEFLGNHTWLLKFNDGRLYLLTPKGGLFKEGIWPKAMAFYDPEHLYVFEDSSIFKITVDKPEIRKVCLLPASHGKVTGIWKTLSHSLIVGIRNELVPCR